MASTDLRVKARVIGAGVAVVGLVVLLAAGRQVFTSDVLTMFHTAGVGAAALAAGVVLVGLVAYDLRRVRWAVPVVQLGSVLALLAMLPLIGSAILGVRSSADEMAPAFVFAAITARLCVFVIVLAAQTRADARRAGLD